MFTPPSSRPARSCSRLVHQAAASFERVALYFENSLLPPDWNLLPSAAAAGERGSSASARRRWWNRPPAWACLEGGGDGGRSTLAGGRRAKRFGCPPVRTRWRPGTSGAGPASDPPQRRPEDRPRRERVRACEFSYESGGRAIAILDRRAGSKSRSTALRSEPLQLAGPATRNFAPRSARRDNRRRVS